jgi:hypothetical protein
VRSAPCTWRRGAQISWLSLKTKALRKVVHVAPSRRLCRRQVEYGRVNATGCVGPCYPTFAVFNVLGPRGIVDV